MSEPFWDENRIALLKKLWGLLPCAEIGAALGCSKNTVIGKADRLGLSRRITDEMMLRCTETHVRRMRELVRAGCSVAAAADLLGIADSTARSALRRSTIDDASEPRQ